MKWKIIKTATKYQFNYLLLESFLSSGLYREDKAKKCLKQVSDVAYLEALRITDGVNIHAAVAAACCVRAKINRLIAFEIQEAFKCIP